MISTFQKIAMFLMSSSMKSQIQRIHKIPKCSILNIKRFSGNARKLYTILKSFSLWDSKLNSFQNRRTHRQPKWFSSWKRTSILLLINSIVSGRKRSLMLMKESSEHMKFRRSWLKPCSALPISKTNLWQMSLSSCVSTLLVFKDSWKFMKHWTLIFL